MTDSKKIAEGADGGAAQESKALPPMGKAQEWELSGSTVESHPVELDNIVYYGRAGIAPEFNEVHVQKVCKPRSSGISDLAVGAGDTCAVPRPERTPELMKNLREICAGKIAACGEEVLGEILHPAWAREVDLCGFQTFNDIDGENYVCGKEKHSPKVKHGDWIKI